MAYKHKNQFHLTNKELHTKIYKHKHIELHTKIYIQKHIDLHAKFMYKDFKNKRRAAYKSTSIHTIISFNKERVTYKKNTILVNIKIISSTKHIELQNTLFHLTNIQKNINSAKKN